MPVRIKLSRLPRRYDPRLLPEREDDACVIHAAPAMLRMLASMCQRPNAPAAVDISRLLQECGIEIDYG